MTNEEALEELDTLLIPRDGVQDRLADAFEMAIEALKRQKTGKWIDCSDEGYVECPFCGHATNCEDNIDELHYCFYCGARMEADEEAAG